jgi:hypothetical protein
VQLCNCSCGRPHFVYFPLFHTLVPGHILSEYIRCTITWICSAINLSSRVTFKWYPNRLERAHSHVPWQSHLAWFHRQRINVMPERFNTLLLYFQYINKYFSSVIHWRAKLRALSLVNRLVFLRFVRIFSQQSIQPHTTSILVYLLNTFWCEILSFIAAKFSSHPATQSIRNRENLIQNHL